MGQGEPKHSQVEITVSWKTIFQILMACVLVYLALRLRPLAELLFLALLIATSLRPLLGWTRRHRWPHWAGVLLTAVLLLGSASLLVGILVPTIVAEGHGLLERRVAFKEQILKEVPPSGSIRDAVDYFLNSPTFSDPEPLLRQLFSWGSVAVQGVAGCFLVLIVAIYFVSNEARLYQWLLAFLPEIHRRKMAEAADEIGSVVAHYMAGQFITSALCATYAFAVLQALRVPDAALLAVLAGVLDVLPLIGFFLFTIPAMAVALTVSPATAGLVGLLYGGYHLAENYFIVPKVYGNRLKLSPLAVLISCLAAGWVDGVVGIIIVLPIVASYPIVERIWLRPHLQRDTVRKHAEIEAEFEGTGH